MHQKGRRDPSASFLYLERRLVEWSQLGQERREAFCNEKLLWVIGQHRKPEGPPESSLLMKLIREESRKKGADGLKKSYLAAKSSAKT